MRRKDREITTREEIGAILSSCKVCRIAMAYDNVPYIVPMNFGFEWIENRLVLYFHCAKEGRKIDFLRANNTVCFEMDCCHELTEGDTACDYSFRFASLIGDGTADFLEEVSEKEHALQKIMEHQTGKTGFAFQKHIVDITCIFRITANRLAAKKRI